MTDRPKLLAEMNDRSREVFRRVVEGYLTSGDPVGSRSLTRTMNEKVSAATIRNVMQDLEYLGLLDSPHVSAGRVPTQTGLRLFVDGLLEVGIARTMSTAKRSTPRPDRTNATSRPCSTGSARRCRASPMARAWCWRPKHEAPIRHIEFVSLASDRALVVLVFADGHVENRVFTPPPGQTASSMREAANFLNAMAEGRTLSDLRQRIKGEITQRRREIDKLAADLVESGLALWENEGESYERLIVRGRANLLSDASEAADLDRIRSLFDDLERKRDIAEFLELAEEGEGVRIFIGSENKLVLTFGFLSGGLSLYER